MKYKILLILSLITILFTLGGCSKNSDTSTASPNKITAKDAKEMMDQDSNVIILDVRTQEEYDSGHIEGAILIPDFDIEEKAENVLTDKAATILVYCRSGRRSAIAAQSLVDLGYTSIYDFGGIIDWDYDVVTE